MSTSPNEARFLELLPKIEKILGAISRRYALDPDEADDFGAWAKLKLIEDDYRRIRAFQRRSKMSTYLRAVLANLFRDYRIEKWGKYRVSKAATRLGPAAIALDRLIRRDRRTEHEAVQILLARDDIEEDEAQLERLARELPVRSERHEQTEPEEFFVTTPSSSRTDRALEHGEHRQRTAPVVEALRRAISELPSEARLILNLRFFDGLKVVEISRRLECEAKPLYRHIDKLLRQLRQALVEEGIDQDLVQELLAQPLAEIAPEPGNSPEIEQESETSGDPPDAPRRRASAAPVTASPRLVAASPNPGADDQRPSKSGEGSPETSSTSPTSGQRTPT